MRAMMIPLNNIRPAPSLTTSIASAVQNRVMKFRIYAKYLLGILLLVLPSSCQNDFEAENSVHQENALRHSRSVFDYIARIFRNCNGCLCGRANQSGTTRFVGGEYTTSHEFPWLANVHIKSQSIVSAVLINDRYVLTAGSKVYGATPSEVKVSLGEFDRCALDMSSVNTSVNSVTVHPQYNRESHAHDLALIRLTRPVKFDDGISPICLPNILSVYFEKVATTVGWTIEKENDSNSRSCRPRKLNLPLLDHNECLRSGLKLSNFHNDSGCIGVLGANSFGCENDAGSTVQCRSYLGVYDLIGIVSDANDCDQVGSTIFTRIMPHLNWILQETRDACYCSKYL